MDFCDWCQLSQDEQNIQRINHLHANLRYTENNSMISTSGLAAFKRALGKLAGTIPSPVAAGQSEVAVVKSSEEQYRSPRPPGYRDFRLQGTTVSDPPRPTIFVSLSQLDPALPSASGTAGPRLSPTLRPGRLRWITTVDHLARGLNKARIARGDLDELALFSEIVATLGLKASPRSGTETVYRLSLYKAGRRGAVRRPHALSTGYGDRFCCNRRRFDDYGRTMNNQSGNIGLPEAISFAKDLIELAPSTTEYADFRRVLSKFAPWITIPSSPYIEARLRTADVHALDLSYAEIQTKVIRRLNERREHCVKAGGTRECGSYCS